MPEVLYIKDMAKLLGKTEASIRSKIQRGEDLPKITRVGRRIAWEVTDCKNWIESKYTREINDMNKKVERITQKEDDRKRLDKPEIQAHLRASFMDCIIASPELEREQIVQALMSMITIQIADKVESRRTKNTALGETERLWNQIAEQGIEQTILFRKEKVKQKIIQGWKLR